MASIPFGSGNTLKNLELAIRGEEFEVKEVHPFYLEIARFQSEKRLK